MTLLTVCLDSVLSLTDDQFFHLCQQNRDLKFERNAKGDLVIMTPTGGESGVQNAELTTEVVMWNRQEKLGVVFDSSTGFKLPDGATRSPNTAWVQRDRWLAVSPEQRKRFPPLAPDSLVELRSESDDLNPLQEKLQEYIDNGVRLGWLIDPIQQQVEIYRPDRPVEVVPLPATLSGEAVLPGFVLALD